MKRIFLIVALMLILALFAGCNSSAGGAPSSSAPAATTTPSSSTAVTTVPSSATGVSAGPAITREEAQAIALADAGFTTQEVTRLRTEPELDDRIAHYDVEFYKDGFEYDYEIDAATGAILTSEKDRED